MIVNYDGETFIVQATGGQSYNLQKICLLIQHLLNKDIFGCLIWLFSSKGV
jgi:hypothetical protein